MLLSVEIRNFQSHKHSVFEFAPGMNVITGSSDSGKSAVMRAMLWALNNRPSGEAFKNWNAKEDAVVDVTMEFDNDWFTKSRHRGKNKYETAASGHFEALRSDVPEEVTGISQVCDYNLQTQFQPYFMLQDSAGERAKQLNHLIGLDIIDTIFKKLNGKIQTTKTAIKFKEGELTKIETEIEELAYLDTVAVLVEKMNSDIDRHKQTMGRAESLRLMIGSLQEIDSKIANASEILKINGPYLSLKLRIELHHNKYEGSMALADIITNLKNIDERMTEDVEWLDVERPYSLLKNKIDGTGDLKHKISVVCIHLDSLRDINRRLDVLNIELDDSLTIYTNKLEKSGTCPTCFSSMSSTSIKKLKERLR